jgi:hypothetical protein
VCSGTNLFRVATWGALAWQILFPLVLVGIVTRHARMLGDSMPAPKRAATIAAAVVFALIGSTLIALAFLLWPNVIGPAKLTVLGLGVVCLVWPLSVRLARRIPERVRPWLVGRRVWGTGFVIFAGTLACLYIADFTMVILASVVLLFDGEEIGKLLSRGPRPARPIEAPQPSVGGRGKRAAVVIFCWWHVTAMLGASLHSNPTDDPRSSWRERLDAAFLYWTNTTVFAQHHLMFAGGAPTSHAQLDISVQQPGAELLWIGDGLGLDDDPRFDEQANIRRELGTEKRWRHRHARWICRQRGLVDGTTLTYWSTRHVLPTPAALARDGIEQARLDAETHTEIEMLSVNVCPDGTSALTGRSRQGHRPTSSERGRIRIPNARAQLGQLPQPRRVGFVARPLGRADALGVTPKFIQPPRPEVLTGSHVGIGRSAKGWQRARGRGHAEQRIEQVRDAPILLQVGARPTGVRSGDEHVDPGRSRASPVWRDSAGEPSRTRSGPRLRRDHEIPAGHAILHAHRDRPAHAVFAERDLLDQPIVAEVDQRHHVAVDVPVEFVGAVGQHQIVGRPWTNLIRLFGQLGGLERLRGLAIAIVFGLGFLGRLRGQQDVRPRYFDQITDAEPVARVCAIVLGMSDRSDDARPLALGLPAAAAAGVVSVREALAWGCPPQPRAGVVSVRGALTRPCPWGPCATRSARARFRWRRSARARWCRR